MAAVQAFRARLHTQAWYIMLQQQLLHTVRGLSSLQLPVRTPTVMSPRAEDCQSPAEVCCVLPGPQSLRAWTCHKAHLSRISYCLMERRVTV